MPRLYNEKQGLISVTKQTNAAFSALMLLILHSALPPLLNRMQRRFCPNYHLSPFHAFSFKTSFFCRNTLFRAALTDALGGDAC